MSMETGRPRQKPLPCSANPLSHQVTQLRNSLAQATDKVSLADIDTEKAIKQLKLALGALDEALVILANEEGNHVVPKRGSCEEQTDRKSLTPSIEQKSFRDGGKSLAREAQQATESEFCEAKIGGISGPIAAHCVCA